MQGSNPEGQAGRVASEWKAYGGSDRGDRYSPADLITPDNVGKLKKAWEFHPGDLSGEGDPGEITYQVTPLKVGDNLVICTPPSTATPVAGDSGRERGSFTRTKERLRGKAGVSRVESGGWPKLE